MHANCGFVKMYRNRISSHVVEGSYVQSYTLVISLTIIRDAETDMPTAKEGQVLFEGNILILDIEGLIDAA